MKKKIAIIIPVHNSLEFTKACLNLLLPLTREASSAQWQFDIIVVDDGSTDGTSEWILKNHPEVRLVEGDGQLWWSGGINKGMQYALHTLNVDYILWWNNDIYPADDYFENLKMVIERGDRNTIFGSKIYHADDPSIIWAYGGYFHRWWGHSYLFGQGAPDSECYSKSLEAHWLPGMGTLLSREAVLKIGDVNDTDFPQYHGDVDYTIRARLIGCHVVVHPSLRIWNHTTHSSHINTSRQGRGLAALHDIRSQHHLRKEWLLYSKYIRNPLAYLVLARKYVGVMVRGWG